MISDTFIIIFCGAVIGFIPGHVWGFLRFITSKGTVNIIPPLCWCDRFCVTFMWLRAILWRYQMETFSALLAICAGNSPVPAEFAHKGQRRGALMFSWICTRINGLVNNREAGELRRHRAHYAVSNGTVILVVLNQLQVTWKYINTYFNMDTGKVVEISFVGRQGTAYTLLNILNTMAVDGLATQKVKSSSARALTSLSRKIWF